MLRLFAFVIAFSQVTPLMAGALFLEYTTGGSKVIREWDPPTIKWRYNPDGAPAGAKETIEAAFNAWATQTQSTVTFEYSGTTNQSAPALDGFCDIFFNVNFSSLGLSNDIIALTFRNGSIADTIRSKGDRILEDADIVLNPALANQWVTSEPTLSSDLDLQEILTHEIGHLLGLAHSFLIDSMMYPAKPRPTTDAALKALFRVPKRTLAQDDAAWLGTLYPNEAFEANTATVAGNVRYEDEDYIGAQVVAIKVGESDSSFTFYPNETTGDLVVKGLKNVAAFSEEDGDFEMKGLEPGSYVFAIQDGDGFLTFSLANVSDYLRVNASFDVMPTSFFSNPDCGTGGTLTPSNVNASFAAQPPISLTAGRALCGLDFIAHTGFEKCLSSPEDSSSCGGDGGCVLEESVAPQLVNWKGLGLSVLGILIILYSLKIRIGKPPKVNIRKKRSP